MTFSWLVCVRYKLEMSASNASQLQISLHPLYPQLWANQSPHTRTTTCPHISLPRALQLWQLYFLKALLTYCSSQKHTWMWVEEKLQKTCDVLLFARFSLALEWSTLWHSFSNDLSRAASFTGKSWVLFQSYCPVLWNGRKVQTQVQQLPSR